MASDWFKGQSSVVVLTLLISKSDNKVFCYLSLRLSDKQHRLNCSHFSL